jgi:hypothetical protein
MLIYPLLHGTLFSPGWLDKDYLKPLRDARAAFGMADARFIGYWENHPGIRLTPANEKLPASVYAKDDKLWLVVGNLSDEAKQATASLDLAKLCPSLDPKRATVRNVFGSGSLNGGAGTVTVVVPPKSLRVIELCR